METQAIAINNRNVILGSSSSSSGWSSVLWTWNGVSWGVRAIRGGINALAQDDSRIVVGQTANQASWGAPDHVGSLGIGVSSHATGISPDGSAAIGESTYPVIGPGSPHNAWVADRAGQVTFLPLTNASWQQAFGRSVNSCGLAVGSHVDFSGRRLPAYWNPGC